MHIDKLLFVNLAVWPFYVSLFDGFPDFVLVDFQEHLRPVVGVIIQFVQGDNFFLFGQLGGRHGFRFLVNPGEKLFPVLYPGFPPAPSGKLAVRATPCPLKQLYKVSQ